MCVTLGDGVLESLSVLMGILHNFHKCIFTFIPHKCTSLQGPEVRTCFLVDPTNHNARIPRIELEAGELVAIYGDDEINEVSVRVPALRCE